MPDRARCIVAAALTLLTACGSHVIDGTPKAAPVGQERPTSSVSTQPGGISAFCAAVDSGAHAITRSHGDLQVVLHSFSKMNAVAPAGIKPDVSYVVNAIQHALAVHQLPNLVVLGEHTHAVARWRATHCQGA